MPKFPMLALKALTYAGKRHKPGDLFEMIGQDDVRLYHALGWVEFAPAQFDAEPEADVMTAANQRPAPVALAAQIDAALGIAPATADEHVADTVDTAQTPADDKSDEAVPEVAQQPEVIADAPADVPADVPADAPTQEEAPSADAEISPRTGKAKRPYKRRDMVAED